MCVCGGGGGRRDSQANQQAPRGQQHSTHPWSQGDTPTLRKACSQGDCSGATREPVEKRKENNIVCEEGLIVNCR